MRNADQRTENRERRTENRERDRSARSRFFIFFSTLLVASSTSAQSADDLKPRLATLAEGAHDVATLLRELERQTGNRVLDQRSSEASRRVKIAWNAEPFWPALDRLASAVGARVSPHVHEAAAVLLDGPPRKGTVVYADLVRLEVKRIRAELDLETNQRTCVIGAEAAWEPRLEPLYLTVEQVTGSYAPPKDGKAMTFADPGRVAQPVARRVAQDFELRFPAPDRDIKKIARLAGALRILGPTKMLTFELTKLEPIAAGGTAREVQQDGVKVALTRLTTNRDMWSLDVLIRNPPETPAFESFQTWLDNNRIHLERTVGGKRVVWEPAPEDWHLLGDLTSRQAHIRYYFNKAQTRGEPADWTLVLRTPGRMVEWTIPFEFRDLPLP